MTTPININDNADKFLTDAQLNEILRRQMAFDNCETSARLLEEVLAELEQLYSK